MSVEPVTITTTHDSPAWSPEDHQKQAAQQMGIAAADLQCVGAGPDEAIIVKQPVFSEDGTLLSPAVTHYTRRTTWEQRPMPVAPPVFEAAPEKPISHAIPKLPRGARWHGIIEGVEGSYVSDGATLHHVDSAEAKAIVNQ